MHLGIDADMLVVDYILSEAGKCSERRGAMTS